MSIITLELPNSGTQTTTTTTLSLEQRVLKEAYAKVKTYPIEYFTKGAFGSMEVCGYESDDKKNYKSFKCLSKGAKNIVNKLYFDATPKSERADLNVKMCFAEIGFKVPTKTDRDNANRSIKKY